ncbi:unnamed protein product [Toxocara canis]|uniref:BTB and MATH domain-containing protein 39 n=1 Tax=Toxocara canis TaxID=6265 RepID=A0A183TWV5_TOXCA|nr:unnamed protein product [Toxocara canis]
MSIAITSDVLHCTDEEPSVSSFDRPFKLLVRDQTFLIDSASLSKVSPVFAVMMFGKDFENGRELEREIVDEKSDDISLFLGCLDDAKSINEGNFATVLRLANKYQVLPLIDSCEQFILIDRHFRRLKPDQLLTLLLAANDFHSKKEVIVKLILRLAAEDRTTLSRLKLSRLLPPQLYGAVIGANLNLSQVREIETMNAHLFKMEHNRTQYRRSACDMCKKITNAAYCEGCKRMLCEVHWKLNKCTSDYGARMLNELRTNMVDFEWD